MILFCVTLLLTVAALLRIAHLASPRRYLAFAALLLAWMALTGTVAYNHGLSDFNRFPPIIMPFIVIAIITATVFGFTLNREVPLTWLIGFQAFRIPVEIFLYSGFVAGFVPVQMTWEGRNFDVLTGLAAIPIAWLASRNSLPVWAMQLWNLAGYFLLLNIMGIAILSLPTPIRLFHNEPANVFVTQIPYVWLPALLVPAAWFGHIALFRRPR